MSEENGSIVRRYFEEIWNQRRMDKFDEFYTKDFVPHGAVGATNAAAVKQAVIMTHKAFPDLHVEMHDEIVAGDKVVARYTVTGTQRGDWLNIPATGKQVSMAGITIFRLTGGKIAEFWLQTDVMGMMQQLGVIPTPEQP